MLCLCHAQVGFEHWQSHAKAKGSDKAFEMGGIDMLLFNPEGHVTDLVQFTMEVGGGAGRTSNAGLSPHVLAVSALHMLANRLLQWAWHQTCRSGF